MKALPHPEIPEITSDVKQKVKRILASNETSDELNRHIRYISDENDVLPIIHYLLTPKVQSWGLKTKDFEPDIDMLVRAVERAANYSSSMDNSCYLIHHIADNFTKEECHNAFSYSYGREAIDQISRYNQGVYIPALVEMFDLDFYTVSSSIDRLSRKMGTSSEEDATQIKEVFEFCLSHYGEDKVFGACNNVALYEANIPSIQPRLNNYIANNPNDSSVLDDVSKLFKRALMSTEPDLLVRLVNDFQPDLKELATENLLSYQPERVKMFKDKGFDLFGDAKTTPLALFQEQGKETEAASFSSLRRWLGHGIGYEDISQKHIEKAIDDREHDFLNDYFEKLGNAGDYINDLLMPYARNSGNSSSLNFAKSWIEKKCDYVISNAPLVKAIEEDNSKAVTEFLNMKHFNIEDPKLASMVYAYSLKGKVKLGDELKEQLLNANMDASANKSALLKEALQERDLELITYCFENGADIMADGDAIMRSAIFTNNKEVMRLVYKYARDELEARADDWQQMAYQRDKYTARDFIRELPKWKLVADDEVSRTTFPMPGDRDQKLTQVFNFSSRTVTALFVNGSDKTSNMDVINFNQFQNDSAIQKAFNILMKMGGTPEPYEVVKRQANTHTRMSLAVSSQRQASVGKLSARNTK